MSDRPATGGAVAGEVGARTGADLAIALHGAEAAAAFRERVLALWPQVFEPVADEHQWRERFWEQHRTRHGFRLVTAAEGDLLRGFGWGYTGENGQWWSDMVGEALGGRGTDWVGGHFELVELAVRPDDRGRGLGGALHDALLADLPHSRALLQTDADPRGSGHRLYRARGWQVLGDLTAQKVVMGKLLRP